MEYDQNRYFFFEKFLINIFEIEYFEQINIKKLDILSFYHLEVRTKLYQRDLIFSVQRKTLGIRYMGLGPNKISTTLLKSSR